MARSEQFTRAELEQLCETDDYAGTDYCRNRLPGETPAEFNARRLRERDAPLEVDVARGVRLPSYWPMLAALAIGALAAALTRGR